jgi:hypothetical protein
MSYFINKEILFFKSQIYIKKRTMKYKNTCRLAGLSSAFLFLLSCSLKKINKKCQKRYTKGASKAGENSKKWHRR